MSVVSLFISLFFVWMFGLSAYHKFANMKHYSNLMSSYGMHSPALATAAVIILGVTELSAVILLCVAVTRDIGLLLIIIVLMVYATAMIVQLISGQKRLQCGCAGPSSEAEISSVLVFRNITLAALAFLSIVIPEQLPSQSFQALCFSITTSIFMVLVYLCVQQVITNSQKLIRLKNL